MNATPIKDTIDTPAGKIAVHAATLAQVIRLSNASKNGDEEKQIEAANAIIDACADCAIDGKPSEALDADTAARVLAVATNSKVGNDSDFIR